MTNHFKLVLKYSYQGNTKINHCQ